MKLSLFADADYAVRCNDRHSVSSVAVMLGDSAVSASSTMQHCVTLSTCEAEYVAMARGPKIALEIKAVSDFVQPHLSGCVINMYEDNEAAKALDEKPQGSHRSKYIDLRYYFLRRLLRLEQVVVHSVALAEQHVDNLTKPLGCGAFRRHRDFLTNLLRVFD